MSKDNYLTKAIQWVKNKSISSLRANHKDFEPPKTFINRATQEEVQADISFITKGGRCYTDIALKTDQPQKLITKWKLLSKMASLKQGKLFLLTPRGHKMFVQRLVETYQINATIYSL